MLRAKKSIVEPAAFFASSFRVKLEETGSSKFPVCIYQTRKFFTSQMSIISTKNSIHRNLSKFHDLHKIPADIYLIPYLEYS